MSTLETSCLPSGSPRGAEVWFTFLVYQQVTIGDLGSCLLRNCCQIIQSQVTKRETLGLYSLTDTQTLPTYDWLSDAGITPSTSRTFSRSTLSSALENVAGVTPSLGCNGNTLNAISWYFNLKGSIIDGEFIPISTLTIEWRRQYTESYHRCYRERIVPFVGHQVSTQVWFRNPNIRKFETLADVKKDSPTWIRLLP